jgi:hypothetical protein
VFDEGKGLSTEAQQYDHTAIISGVRQEVDRWRRLPNPNQWQVTPETARLLQHWRHHPFSGIRPFFCQVEAVETVIWLTEVAPRSGKSGQRFLDHLANANQEANPELMRLALKLNCQHIRANYMPTFPSCTNDNTNRIRRLTGSVAGRSVGAPAIEANSVKKQGRNRFRSR